MITIALGADHRGFALKEFLKQQKITQEIVTWLDCGAQNDERSDYPLFALEVAKAIQAKKASCGILLCGTGVGMAIAANRFSGIYAGVAWNQEIARKGKEDDNINVLVIPADFIQQHDVLAIVQAWLGASFKEGRYAQRLAMIDAIK